MGKRKRIDDNLILKVPKNATLKQIYAIVRKEFTADDFYRCIEPGPTVPFDKVLAKLEDIHRRESRRLEKKRDAKKKKK